MLVSCIIYYLHCRYILQVLSLSNIRISLGQMWHFSISIIANVSFSYNPLVYEWASRFSVEEWLCMPHIIVNLHSGERSADLLTGWDIRILVVSKSLNFSQCLESWLAISFITKPNPSLLISTTTIKFRNHNDKTWRPSHISHPFAKSITAWKIYNYNRKIRVLMEIC